MASTYNPHDKTNYGTSAERLADAFYVTQQGAKWYDTEENSLYVADGTYWRLHGENSRSPEMR